MIQVTSRVGISLELDDHMGRSKLQMGRTVLIAASSCPTRDSDQRRPAKLVRGDESAVYGRLWFSNSLVPDERSAQITTLLHADVLEPSVKRLAGEWLGHFLDVSRVRCK